MPHILRGNSILPHTQVIIPEQQRLIQNLRNGHLEQERPIRVISLMPRSDLNSEVMTASETGSLVE